MLVRDGVAEEIRVLTGGGTVDEITPPTGDEKNKAPSVMEGADEEISPLTGDETNKASSVMEGADEEISPLTGDETNKASSVMEGADEEITGPDGGSDESAPEMSCTDSEKMSLTGEIAETGSETDWTELEKVLIVEELNDEENNEAREG